MDLPEVVSRSEWLVARKKFLQEEKEFTKRRDELNANRRRLPMVLVEQDYVFTGPDGPVRLLDVFEGRLQLIVYHFMFAPEWDEGCPNCTWLSDDIGRLEGLHEMQTTFAAISRAPYEKIAAYKEERGWTFPWYSSAGTSFNYDFHVTLDESVLPLEYNYRTKAEWDATPNAGLVQGEQPFDLHGMSCFLRTGDAVHHTYSTYGRGTDSLGFCGTVIDLTALGRQEPWELPAGRIPEAGLTVGDPEIAHHQTEDHCH